MSDLEQMLVALNESRSCPTKLAAGQILAEGGWSIFPLPNYMKFDKGLSYLNSTIDGGVFTEMAEDVMRRHECHDVNIALVPARCIVPLLVLDLDGAEAIAKFRDDAWARGHADLGMWMRVNTTRPDDGRHIYFTAPQGQGYSNSIHRWGGEVRSAKGHVVMPPSTTGQGAYTWAGEILKEAPGWVLEGLHRAQTPSGTGTYFSDSEMEDLLAKLSTWETDSYGQAGLDALVTELRGSAGRPGHPTEGRNATLARVMNRALDLALERHVNALEAIDLFFQTYMNLFSFEEQRERQVGGEVIRCARSWARNKDDIAEIVIASDAAHSWAQQRPIPSDKQFVRDLQKQVKQSEPQLRDWVREFMRGNRG